MRKLVAMIIAGLMCLCFVGCTKTTQRDTKKATDFLENLYSVSDKQIENYNSKFKNGAAPESEYLKISEIVKPYMTDDAYKKLLQNCTYSDIVKNASRNNTELQKASVTLKEDNSGEGYIQFSYTVNFTAKNLKDGTEGNKTEQGVIQTNSQNGKVTYIRRTVVADTLDGSNK